MVGNGGVFLFFSKENCNLNLTKDEEVPVKLYDLIAVWVLFLAFVLVSICYFVYELARVRVACLPQCTVTWD